jgi:hypothetical protein
MYKAYLVSGTIICILFIFATLRGWKIIDPAAVAASRPVGGAHYYHK